MIQVDARGDRCPIPVVKTKKAMDELQGAGMIEVLVDNETSSKNVEKMAKNAGAGCQAERISDQEYKLTITVTEAVHTVDSDDICSPAGQKGKTVVVIASDRMGDGDEALGRLLIKGFLFAVSQLEPLPDVMLFYNSGARLTVEGSDSLEDLKFLEEQGMEIMTCGTCLNHYGLTEQLAVGSVTNMYAIVEQLAQAGKVIRP